MCRVLQSPRLSFPLPFSSSPRVAMSEEQLNSALNLMRRMPPSSVENSLAGLIELVPDLTDDLLNHVDQPLKVKKDNTKNQEFIMCDYNRDGDSFR